MNAPPIPKCASAPVFIAFVEPFRLVINSPDDAWHATFEQLNSRTYDYLKLNRVSLTIECDICGSQRVHFGYDGSVILIGIDGRPEDVVDGINRFLGGLLLGGVFTEAVNVESLDRGVIYQTGYVQPFGMAKSAVAKLLYALRTRHAGGMQAAYLERPKQILGCELAIAWQRGSRICDKVKELSPSFVLMGITAHARHDCQASLSNLWIAIEQCTSNLWSRFVVEAASIPNVKIDGREGFLRDTRAWPMSVRLELLFQIGVVDIETYREVSVARKARNRLAHEGKTPLRQDCTAAMAGCLRLLSIASTSNNTPESLLDLVAAYQERQPSITLPPPSVPSEPIPVSQLERGFWLKLPSLPGDAFWDGPEYPFMFEIHPE